MPFTSDGTWIPRLSEKGLQVFNCYTRYLLVHGPRKSGKTISVLHKLCRHAWEVPNANILIVAKTLSNAKSGVWADLKDFVIPEWVDSGIGFRITMQEKTEADTKLTHMKVSNRFGGETDIQIKSLIHDSDVETRFKSTRYSMIYIVEADGFGASMVMDILGDQLRIIGLPFEAHQMILDCNPPAEGPKHWLYKKFFLDPVDPKITEEHPEFARDYDQIKIAIPDNPFLDKKEAAELIRKYSPDPHKKARFVDGEWVEDDSNGLFADTFERLIHVVGSIENRKHMVPGGGCIELVSGWDIGDVNHGASILAPRPGARTVFDMIDEAVVVDAMISLGDFVELFIEKMNRWEAWFQKKRGVNPVWRFWSDNSSFRFKSAIGGFEVDEVYELSKGRILLEQAPKPRVKSRIMLLNKLLLERRFYISAQLENALNMIRLLKGTGPKKDQIPPASPHKHSFDSITYALYSECPFEFTEDASPKEEETSGTGVISIP